VEHVRAVGADDDIVRRADGRLLRGLDDEHEGVADGDCREACNDVPKAARQHSTLLDLDGARPVILHQT
jgi:hypothetical protein